MKAQTKTPRSIPEPGLKPAGFRVFFSIALTALLAITLSLTGCVSSCSSEKSERVTGSLPLPEPHECPAGSPADTVTGCPEGGLDSYSFFVKDRRSSVPNTESAYSSITAEKLAVSPGFVLFRDTVDSSLMTPAEAEEILGWLEGSSAYQALKDIYGGGTAPDVQNTGRVVILVYDIQDDYRPDNPAYIGGYFAPRDLFSDGFTSSLFTNPDFINDPAYGNLSSIETAENLTGRSNEAPVIHMDIHPFFDGTASGDTEKAKCLFRESVLHEASHMFTYYRRVIDLGVRNHLTWIAEGIAEQAPAIISGGDCSQTERMEQYSLPLARALLADGPSLLDMNSSGNALAGYLQVNLFFNYLRHRAGSYEAAAEIIAYIVSQNDYTVTGVAQALENKSGSDFESFFGEWAVTNWLMSSGRSIASFTETDGSAVDPDAGSPSMRNRLSYSASGISPAGGPAPSFGANSTPLCDQGLMCLLPSSYIFFDYTPQADRIYIPLNEGMQNGLKLVLIRLNPDGINADISLHNIDSQIQLLSGVRYNFIVYNPRFTVGCITTGMLPWDQRNMARWIGGGRTGWQAGTGAESKNADRYFYRGQGVSVKRGAEGNFIYTADSMSHSISRWDVDTGTYMGRYGSILTSTECVGDESVAPGYIFRSGKLVNNYCRRSLSSPRGAAVDSAGNLYVADTNNHRVVKIDSSGNFTAWLGHNLDDTWQGPEDLPPMSFTELIAAGYAANTSMFQNPWSILLDEGNGVFYVTNNGSNRISKRSLADGSFLGFIGNGRENWDTTPVYNSNFGSMPGYFKKPKGMAMDSDYIYVADEENHRISRWTHDGRNADASGDPASIWIGGDLDGWHNGATEQGITQGRRSFNYPGDVTVNGDYLYIADRKNQRIARWDRITGAFTGWLGGGVTQWETEKDGPPQEPVGGAYQYPSIFMLEPVGLTVSESPRHKYMYVTTVYNGRVSRWNLDCVENNADGDCYEE